MAGLLSYGAYLPCHRLDRSEIAAVLGESGGVGARAVAGYDEDTTSMAVEAARAALMSATTRGRVQQVLLASATPAYLDKTNATLVHAALGLASQVLAVDMIGSVRSGAGALALAAQSGQRSLVVLSDLRIGLPGGSDERDGGDGAAAFLLGPDTADLPMIAEVLAQDAVSDEVLERWRLPGAVASRVWEERFAEDIYGPQAAQALTAALERAGVRPEELDHLVVAGLHARACRSVPAAVGVPAARVAADLTREVGNCGTAHPGLVLADVLDRAGPGETIAVVTVGDGASVLVLRTTAALAAVRQPHPVRDQIAEGRPSLRYATYLTWRGLLTREPPRRPDPEPPYAPPAHRRSGWKHALLAAVCTKCGTRQMPPGRVCLSCHSVDAQREESMEQVAGTVVSSTVDRLAFSPSPPILLVVVDFDGGGRLRCELTDATEADAVIGSRVEMTFRRTVTARGIHNYFWKARPLRLLRPAPAGAS